MYSSDEESSDSLGTDPIEFEGRYERAFVKLVREFFDKNYSKRKMGTRPPGYDHAEFVRKFNSMKSSFDEEDYQPVYSHIICNQYADAMGSSDRKWETHHMMKEYYDDNRLSKLASSSSSTNDLDLLNGLSDEEEEQEQQEEQPENTIQVKEVLDQLNISKLRDVSRISETVMQRMWLNKKKVEVNESTSRDKTFLVYDYPDTPDTRDMMMESVKLGLIKLAQTASKRSASDLLSGTPPPPKKQKVPTPLPQEEAAPVSSYGYGNGYITGNTETATDTDRVYWGDIMNELGFSELVMGVPNSDEIMKEVKMTCGRKYVEMFKGPERNVVTNRREYTGAHRANMMKVAKEVMSTLENNLKRN